jgi:hypothetical protein
MASTSLSATHQSEFLQEKIPYQMAPPTTRSKKVHKPPSTTSKDVKQAHDGQRPGNVLSATQPWIRQTICWSKGTRIEVKFEDCSKYYEGTVDKNDNMSFFFEDKEIRALTKQSFTVHFDDDENHTYEHNDFLKLYFSRVLNEQDASTLLANNLLCLVLSDTRPESQLIRKVLGSDMMFQSKLQGEVEYLLNSEPGSADRTARMGNIVNQIKPHHETLIDNPDANQAVLRWMTNIVQFEKHILHQDVSSSVDLQKLSDNVELEVEEVGKLLNLIFCTAN